MLVSNQITSILPYAVEKLTEVFGVSLSDGNITTDAVHVFERLPYFTVIVAEPVLLPPFKVISFPLIL